MYAWFFDIDLTNNWQKARLFIFFFEVYLMRRWIPLKRIK